MGSLSQRHCDMRAVPAMTAMTASSDMSDMVDVNDMNPVAWSTFVN